MSGKNILAKNLVGRAVDRGEYRAKAICHSLILMYKTTYSDDELNKWPFHFAIFTSIQFIVLTIVAIFFYPGGAILDQTGLGYPFFQAFYSELGMTVTSGGKSNLTSAIIFTIALTVTGLGISVFHIAIRRFFLEPGMVRTISTAGSVFGVISGVLYIAAALRPGNLFWEEHIFLATLASQSFLAAALCYTIAIFTNKNYPNVYALVYILFAVLLIGYILLCEYGPRVETSDGFIIQATCQKVIVLSAIVCKLIQSWGALRQEE
ncbi:MAG: hypothetical protein ABIJ24_04840 [Nitrospinota bacterium]|nr:hypothetical protein [Nitrospinota bacterium]